MRKMLEGDVYALQVFQILYEMYKSENSNDKVKFRRFDCDTFSYYVYLIFSPLP